MDFVQPELVVGCKFQRFAASKPGSKASKFRVLKSLVIAPFHPHWLQWFSHEDLHKEFGAQPAIVMGAPIDRWKVYFMENPMFRPGWWLGVSL